MSSTPSAPSAANDRGALDLQALLDPAARRRWWQRPGMWIAVAAVIALGGAAYWWSQRTAAQAAPRYITEPLKRGKITQTVAANGTVVPTRTVNIGSELSGTVKQVYVDVNDRVKKGQVLVMLDTAKLSDQVKRSEAALLSARAAREQAKATLAEAQANLARLEEVARLSSGQVPSAAELDTARANVTRAAAALESAAAAVAQAEAQLSTDRTNLSKASIVSPIDGVVLSRTVEPGNAVAASLQAVTLLSLAEDLAQVRVELAVDEADVGNVRPGQKAFFTVSSYPTRRYPASVTLVAFGSTKTDNVITYTTYLEVRNDDLSLRPGMTAAATIVANEHDGVLVVPNTALRFNPESAAANAKAGSSGGVTSMLMPRMPSTGPKKPGTENRRGPNAERRIWVLDQGQPVPITVTVGISDGRLTEVSAPELKEGMAVIVDQRSGASK